MHGTPHDQIVKSLALDLEKRGFIVFIVVSSNEDDQTVVNEVSADIRPLHIDILDVSFLEVYVIAASVLTKVLNTTECVFLYRCGKVCSVSACSICAIPRSRVAS